MLFVSYFVCVCVCVDYQRVTSKVCWGRSIIRRFVSKMFRFTLDRLERACCLLTNWLAVHQQQMQANNAEKKQAKRCFPRHISTYPIHVNTHSICNYSFILQTVPLICFTNSKRDKSGHISTYPVHQSVRSYQFTYQNPVILMVSVTANHQFDPIKKI